MGSASHFTVFIFPNYAQDRIHLSVSILAGLYDLTNAPATHYLTGCSLEIREDIHA